MHFLVIKREYLITAILLFIVTSIGLLLLDRPEAETVAITDAKQTSREIHLVTGEFKTVTESGKEIESYRWDPGVIFIEKGEKVKLNIYGINGKEHPFSIEGTNITGTVKKGEETIVPLEFNKDGIYRLICLTHHDKDNNGPMIAYIIVD
ncbi:hypothetical protein [Bacillus sp. B15-48]|uniref:hypothetical protein n=1 Tax=Bacillus sp. B15-48 TaxID=1548601 RepID=UPI00193F089F|nr:hypothetical protein [Bacillus sp. B15-48]MBM4761955.1 hypothetical protein [Bacillus sp. B15-48]